ncbi:MAG: hypothetical protein Kow0037_31480 [Calditrichia bacterium]
MTKVLEKFIFSKNLDGSLYIEFLAVAKKQVLRLSTSRGLKKMAKILKNEKICGLQVVE